MPKALPWLTILSMVMFSASSAWGAWIASHTEAVSALAELPKVIHLMEWVLRQDETYNNGSPHVFLGVYHASLPPMLGGRPDLSREHFQAALRITQRQSLMVQVLMARFYARQTFDHDLYESLLHEVLNHENRGMGELTLQNAIAIRHARTLLEEADDFF